MLKQSGARKWRSHTPNLLSLQLFAFRVISSAAWWGANLINLFYYIRLELLLKAVKNGFWLRSSSHPSTNAATALLYSEQLRPFSPPKFASDRKFRCWTGSSQKQQANMLLAKSGGAYAQERIITEDAFALIMLAGIDLGSQALIKLRNNVDGGEKLCKGISLQHLCCRYRMLK